MTTSRRSSFAFAAIAVVSAALAGACSDGDTEVLPVEDPMSGGETTIFDDTRDAFARPLANLHGDRRDDFFLGNGIFNRGWISAPASVADFDGLGPLFNATNCSGCHFKDGRGRPPTGSEAFESMLIRLSIPGEGPHGGPNPDPSYGDQLQGNAIFGVPAEGDAHITYVEVPGRFKDGEAYSLRRPTYTIDKLAYGPLDPRVMMSPRTAPMISGLGLLEAVPEESIVALADPNDADRDGVSGRPNRVWDQASGTMMLGRFGWKANQPSLHQQNAGAFLGDMGITSSLFGGETCTSAQEKCAAAPTGPTPQLREDLLDQVTYYTKTLAVPGRRNIESDQVRRGRKLFGNAGCAKCHTPTLRTGVVDGFPELSNQTIHPFTDLLLHDMGPELADARPDFLASGVEWRTAPLWGVGLIEVVNRHDFLLHDGRARGFAEAVLWHGGEGAASRDAFLAMPKTDRDALVSFLGSL